MTAMATMTNNNNNKESFELLRGSFDSNSFSDTSEIVFPMKKKRFRRRLKNNPSIEHEEMVGNNECHCKIRTLALALFCMVSIGWLVVLTWLTVILHSELNRLTSHVSTVVAGNQGVPDALQKCHSLSKDLQKNQTLIMSRLSGFSLQLVNFSSEMTEVKSGLQAVQDQLRSSPDLVNIPRLIKDLSATVASFGSQIRDLNSTVSTLKDQNGKLDNDVNILVHNLTETKRELVELSKGNLDEEYLTRKMWAQEKDALLVMINQIARNLSVFNNTLNNKLQWTAEDRSKDHKLIESLLDKNENITARVKILEGLDAKEKEYKSITPPFTNSNTNSH